ncbi:MAG: hypothetical protein QXZ66_10085, partial [Thermoproteota archaeon]
EDGRTVLFRGDDLLDNVHGEAITGIGMIRCLPDGTIEGRLSCGGKWGYFFWYRDEVHLPFPL